MLDPQRPAQKNPEFSPARMAHTAQPRVLAGAGIGSVVVLAVVLNGAPGWAVVAIVLGGLAVVLAQSALHVLIPQDSGDRLTWWINRRDQRSRRRQARRCQPGGEESPPRQRTSGPGYEDRC